MPNNYAIILAAGSGTRFGGKQPKQFLELKGKPLWEWLVEAFGGTGLFEKIVLVMPVGFQVGAIHELPLQCVLGGSTRAESVRNGFAALNAQDDDIVLIHDAARPLVSAQLIQRVLEATRSKKAVIPVVPVADTIKKIKGDRVVETPSRAELAAAQTPQGFTCAILKRLYKTNPSLGATATDEAMMVEQLGEKVFTVEGERRNVKVTTMEDLKLVEFWIRSHPAT